MIQSIGRTLDVLEALALANEEQSFKRLQEQLQLPPSTLHRLLQALIERGYVDQNGDNRHYGPGLKIFEVAEAAKQNSRFNLGRVVRPYLQQLTDESGETSNLIIRHDQKIVYVDQVPSSRSVRMFTAIGHHAPLYCTGAGKAILSTLTDDQLQPYVAQLHFEQLTPRTLSSAEALLHEIAQIQRCGFAMDNEEYETGVRCVAAPIVNASGQCIAAISVSGPAARLSYELAERLGDRVRHVTDQCSVALGHGSSFRID